MPAERISKPFKDLSLTLGLNPITKDILSIKNEIAIARSVRNLVFTYPGERFFQPRLGCEIRRSLFENFDETSIDVIKDEIESTLRSYEPRIQLEEVIVGEGNNDFDSLSLNVTIRYRIIGQDIDPQELTFPIQPTR